MSNPNNVQENNVEQNSNHDKEEKQDKKMIFNKFKELQDIIKLEAAKYDSCKINNK
jgi:hypothetical protein